MVASFLQCLWDLVFLDFSAQLIVHTLPKHDIHHTERLHILTGNQIATQYVMLLACLSVLFLLSSLGQASVIHPLSLDHLYKMRSGGVDWL